MLPTVEAVLTRLQGNPSAAAAFDRAAHREAPGSSRRDAVQKALACMAATIAEHEAKKRLLAARRTRIAALQAARLTRPSPVRPAPTPTRSTPTAPTARPLRNESTVVLVKILKMSGITDAEKSAARLELEARNVRLHAGGGYSESLR
ncbi:MAG: hypothetical protein WEB53_09910 [Akkermansiaceae bacterium]